ncbi:MAG: peptide deformylase [Candidatus Kerfeldbacteria bacterium CG08_land_8_20_14_0_20_43_14]|uniref:Peptide deformylase n=1 Tax=Candidatus Kerfeldbacteria bacterium CG08_land_8_20_14_0_20_43_14 TaxID=2014246 RepID=A0A2H0YR79_9BACT|nr:MAG: peptide deformylase [Candidatus Kerfeldbacteria bacterium CG08_land_8_20_14_0_20_43_14]
MSTIITHPNSILRQKAVELRLEEIPKIQELIYDMQETMSEKDGIGLAANQIGILKRIVVIADKEGPLILINPEIIEKSWLKNIMEEGCLSVPGVFGTVKRHKKITVAAINSRGETLKLKAEGMLARVIQHEIDHLDGILFIDKVIKYTEGEPPKST